MDKLSKKVRYLVDVPVLAEPESLITGQLFDGTQFTIKVPRWSIQEAENGKGWLTVDYHGETGNRARITLPSPILTMGHEISVNVEHINKL